MDLVLPGDDLSTLLETRLSEKRRARPNTAAADTPPQPQPPSAEEPLRIHVGPGIIQTSSSQVLALKAGLLHQHPHGTGNRFALRTRQHRRYIPVPNDLVVGIVTARLADGFRVDIGGPQLATLSALAGFEAATRKNRPNYAPGAIVYARVALAHPDLEPELVCFDASGCIPAELFGELGARKPGVPDSDASASNNASASSGSFQLVRTSCHFARSLQSPQPAPLLAALGRRFAFELAAGANGRVFVDAGCVQDALLISRLLRGADAGSWGAVECEREVNNAASQSGRRPASKRMKKE